MSKQNVIDIFFSIKREGMKEEKRRKVEEQRNEKKNLNIEITNTE